MKARVVPSLFLLTTTISQTDIPAVKGMQHVLAVSDVHGLEHFLGISEDLELLHDMEDQFFLKRLSKNLDSYWQAGAALVTVSAYPVQQVVTSVLVFVW